MNKEINDILEALAAVIPDITDLFVITTEGTVGYYSHEDDTSDKDDQSILLATAVNAITEFLSRSGMGDSFEQLIIRHQLGVVIILNIGKVGILAIIAKADVRLGLILFDARKTAASLLDVIGEDAPDLILHTETDDVMEYIEKLKLQYESWESNKRGKKL